jgi:hypothetical protein
MQIAVLGATRPAFPFRRMPKGSGASTNEAQFGMMRETADNDAKSQYNFAIIDSNHECIPSRSWGQLFFSAFPISGHSNNRIRFPARKLL